MSDYTLTISDAEVMRYRFMADVARGLEEADWAAAGFVPGAAVADVGCGPAAVSAVLAEVVGPDGRVTAIERDPAAVEQARAVLAAAGATQVDLRQGEAAETDIPAGSLDAVMMRHVLAHNGGQEQAIVDHLASLVRPGGSVYLLDVDLTAARYLDLEVSLADLQRRYIEFHQRRGNDPQVGLHLGRLLTGAGLTDVVHKGHWSIMSMPPGIRPPAMAAREAMLEAGLATPGELQEWEAALERSDAQDPRPTIFMPAFAAWGRVPS